MVTPAPSCRRYLFAPPFSALTRSAAYFCEKEIGPGMRVLCILVHCISKS